ncbi:MAG: hypothetical protein JWR05_3328 [Mucilaginibacter sp.]|nr:hypothetical protein [Mucilaginibacter sp.]
MEIKEKSVINNAVLNGFIFNLANTLIAKFFGRSIKRDLEYRGSEIVYHYTSFESFQKIITTESLIATNVLYLNDTNEFKYGIDMFEFSLEEILKKKKTSKLIISIIEDIYNKIHESNISDNYVTCFSAEKDQLSQWQAYGDSGRGVAIGFKVTSLSRCFQYHAVGAWVEYDIYRMMNNITLISSEFFNSYSKLVKEFAFEDERHAISIASELYLSQLLPTFIGHYKNSNFKQEKEYRLALKEGKYIQPIELDFMVKNKSLLVPYTKFILKNRDIDDHFKDIPEDMRPAVKPTTVQTTLPIEEIVLGPCVEQAFTEPGLKMFLTKYGYEHIEIKKSCIPLRNFL